IPVVFTEVEKESVQEWLVSFRQLEEQIATLQEALQKLENELNLKNQQLDQIEAVMWDNETLKSVEEELTEGETETIPEKKSKNTYLLSGAFSILTLLVSIFVQPPMQWISLSLLLISLIITVYLFIKRYEKKFTTDQKSSTLIVQKYEKQCLLTEQCHEHLVEIHSVQAHYQEQLKVKE